MHVPPDATKAVPLVSSLRHFLSTAYFAHDDSVYVLTGPLVKEIGTELERLNHMRQALGEVMGQKDD